MMLTYRVAAEELCSARAESGDVKEYSTDNQYDITLLSW